MGTCLVVRSCQSTQCVDISTGLPLAEDREHGDVASSEVCGWLPLVHDPVPSSLHSVHGISFFVRVLPFERAFPFEAVSVILPRSAARPGSTVCTCCGHQHRLHLYFWQSDSKGNTSARTLK